MTVDKNYALAAFNSDELVATGDKGTGKVLIPLAKLPDAGSIVPDSTFQVAFTDGIRFSDKVGVPTFTVPEITTTTTTTSTTTAQPTTTSTTTSTTVEPTTTTTSTTVPPTTSTTTSTTVPPTTTTTSTTTVQPTTTTTSTTTVKPVVENNLLLNTDTPFSMTGNNTFNQFEQMYALSRRLEKGTKVAISFDAVATAPMKFLVQTNGTDGGAWTNFVGDTANTTKKHYEATTTLDDFSEKGVTMRLDNIPSTATITVSNMQLHLA